MLRLSNVGADHAPMNNKRKSSPVRPGTTAISCSNSAAMPRHLRPRKTRQTYTSLFQGEDEEENTPGHYRRRPPGEKDRVYFLPHLRLEINLYKFDASCEVEGDGAWRRC